MSDETQNLKGAAVYPARDPLDSLRRSVAEVMGANPETWPEHGDAALAITTVVKTLAAMLGPKPPATAAEIDRAREMYSGWSVDDIVIDDDAVTSRTGKGVWVSAWVFLPNRE